MQFSTECTSLCCAVLCCKLMNKLQTALSSALSSEDDSKAICRKPCTVHNMAFLRFASAVALDTLSVGYPALRRMVGFSHTPLMSFIAGKANPLNCGTIDHSNLQAETPERSTGYN